MKIIVFTLCVLSASHAPAVDHFSRLQERLADDGFDRAFIAGVFEGSSVAFTFKPIKAQFTIRESKLNYGQFLAPPVVAQCRDYLLKHHETLQTVKEVYGVAPEIVVAILMVETRLGNYTGRYNILNVLASFAVVSDPEVMKATYEKLPPSVKKRYGFNEFKGFCKRKSPWAYRELKAFLHYIQETGTPPHNLFGSMSGAIGFPQFLPSNILRYGRDGNQDGKVDLFRHEDALVSVGHYLKRHGWSDELSEDQKKKVIFTYNRSDYYVNTVLDLARLMEG